MFGFGKTAHICPFSNWRSGAFGSHIPQNWNPGAFGLETDNHNDQDGLALGLEDWLAPSPDGYLFGPAGFWNDVDVRSGLWLLWRRQM